MFEHFAEVGIRYQVEQRRRPTYQFETIVGHLNFIFVKQHPVLKSIKDLLVKFVKLAKSG
jgi:hypothetical protein